MHLVEIYYTHVLGIAYQIVGDATLAARATTTIFERALRPHPRPDQMPVVLWRTALQDPARLSYARTDRHTTYTHILRLANNVASTAGAP